MATTPNESDKKTKYYTVLENYEEEDGTLRVVGDAVPMICRNCALWETETPGLGPGTKMCKEGLELGPDQVMSPHKWSCGEFFIGKGLKAILQKYLALDVHSIQLVKKLARARRKRLKQAEAAKHYEEKIFEWFDSYCEKTGTSLSSEQKREIGVILKKFSFSEQLKYTLPFFTRYASGVANRHKRQLARANRFEGGDWVEWTDRRTGKAVTGIVRTCAAGLIKISSVDPNAEVSDYTFKLREWKKKYNPKHLKKRSDVVR